MPTLRKMDADGRRASSEDCAEARGYATLAPSVISILIVSFNTAPELVACLESLARCAAALPHEIIVVDNDSSDGSVEARSEEHTSELQSPCNLVCRLLLEKKKKT